MSEVTKDGLIPASVVQKGAGNGFGDNLKRFSFARAIRAFRENRAGLCVSFARAIRFFPCDPDMPRTSSGAHGPLFDPTLMFTQEIRSAIPVSG